VRHLERAVTVTQYCLDPVVDHGAVEGILEGMAQFRQDQGVVGGPLVLEGLAGDEQAMLARAGEDIGHVLRAGQTLIALIRR
jgi:hypothetical protein